MNKEEVKYKAIKKVGYGECFSDNINYIIENVDRWCGPVFDLYVDGVKVDNPKQYLEDHKPKEPQTLEEKIVDMCYKIDHLKEENKQLKKDYAQIVSDNCDYLKLEQQRDLYKEVIEEVREYIKDSCYYPELENYSNMTSEEVKELLQILDKGVKNVQGSMETS